MDRASNTTTFIFCYNSPCQERDFQPHVCNLCTKKFCYKHAEPKCHSCPQAKGNIVVTKCIYCAKMIKYEQSIFTASEALENHIGIDCTGYEEEDFKLDKKCARCRRLLNLIIDASCEDCGKYFCVECRLPEKHECEPEPRLMKQKPAISIDLIKEIEKEKVEKKTLDDYFKTNKKDAGKIEPVAHANNILPNSIENWHARKYLPAKKQSKKRNKKQPKKGKKVNPLLVAQGLQKYQASDDIEDNEEDEMEEEKQ